MTLDPHYETAYVVLYAGDCLDVLLQLPDNSVDSIVTDPPSGIGFMQKSWDSDKGGREQWSAWLADVMREAYRVAKPGAHALVWALPRTSHWTACGIEDAGWVIRDRVHHLFGSGFPKSLDVSKAIDRMAGAEREVVGPNPHSSPGRRPGVMDMGGENVRPRMAAGLTARGLDRHSITAPATDAARQWEGWGTALKPSAEDWWLARKPLSEGTVAANVLRWGTGALNVDGCRVGTEGRPARGRSGEVIPRSAMGGGPMDGSRAIGTTNEGRWPAHILITHDARDGERCHAECPAAVMDRQSGEQRDGTAVKRNLPEAGASQQIGIKAPTARGADVSFGGSGGASRFFPQFRWSPDDDPAPFLYTAKAASAERPRAKRDGGRESTPMAGRSSKECNVCGVRLPSASCTHADYRRVESRTSAAAGNVAHPTVKPLELMRWLVRLITPPGGTCLDMFAGSGTTGEAALQEGMRAVLIEREADYLPLIVQRLTRQRDPVAYAKATGTEGEALW